MLAATCRWSSRDALARAARAHQAERRRGDDGDHGARGSERLRAGRARRRRRRRARRRDQVARATRRSAELEIREVNTGIYVFAGRPLLDALPRLGADERPGRAATCRTCSRAARARRDGRRARRSTTPARARRQRPRRSSRASARVAQRRIHERHMLAGVDDRRPAAHRRSTSTSTIGAGHGDRAVHARAIRRDARTIGRSGCTRCAASSSPRRLRARATARRRPVRLPAPRDGAARRAPRPARSSRSRTPTSARARRCPHLSYIGDADVGERTNLGAAHDHRQLRRPRQAPHDDRRARARRRRHLARRAGDASATTPGPAAGSVVTDDVPPRRAGGRPRAPAQRRALRRTRGTPASGCSGGGEAHAPSCRRSTTRLGADERDGHAHAVLARSLPIDYNKRLMLVQRAGEPAARRQHRRASSASTLGPVDAEDVLQRRGLLPLRGVDPRRRRLHRAVDVRQPRRPG